MVMPFRFPASGFQVTMKHVRESNLIEDIDNPTADQDCWRAWCQIANLPSLMIGNILAVHRTVCAHQNDPRLSGFRRQPVWVAGREGLVWSQVPRAMDVWLANLQSMEPREAHVAFETIHPFLDGNGRTGRLLLWWHERSLGMKPSLLTAANRGLYYQWFQQ